MKIHHGLITDDDDSDVDMNYVSQMTIMPQKRSYTMSDVCTSTTDDSEVEIEDVKPKPSRPKKPKKNIDESSSSSWVSLSKNYSKSIASNAPLLEAIQSKSADQMVVLASRNIQNYKNIEFLEWSEYVYIQMCTLKKSVNANSLNWDQLKVSIENYQWSMEVMHNIKKYVGSNLTLATILDRNHQYKIANHHLNPQMVFVSKPSINYAVLKNYKLTLEIITKPLLTNRLPVRFKKVNIT